MLTEEKKARIVEKWGLLQRMQQQKTEKAVGCLIAWLIWCVMFVLLLISRLKMEY